MITREDVVCEVQKTIEVLQQSINNESIDVDKIKIARSLLSGILTAYKNNVVQ